MGNVPLLCLITACKKSGWLANIPIYGKYPHLWHSQWRTCQRLEGGFPIYGKTNVYAVYIYILYIIVNIFKVLTSSIVFGQISEVLNYPSKVFHNCSGEGVTPWKKVGLQIYLYTIDKYIQLYSISFQLVYIIQIYRHIYL